MNSDWRIVKIGALLEEGVILVHKDGNHGANYPKAEEFGSEGVPFLTAKLLDDAGNIDINNAPRLDSEKADKFKFGFVETDDVLLSHNATVGRVAVVPRIQERVLIGTSLTQFRLDKKILLPRYLAAYFSSCGFQNQLAAVMSQTTRNQVPITSQRTLSIVIPTFLEQCIIANILGTLDDRITLLRETNTTLEAIAQAIFKSWFVDFDPVRAKQKGREPEGMDADTAALFPDSFEDSELGLIPKGWHQIPFTDTVHVIGGGTPKTSIPEYWNGDIPWFSVVDAPTISDIFVIDTQKHITEQGLKNSSTKLLAKGTTIISARGTVGRLALVGRQMAMNQSCYGLSGKADDAYFTYFSTYRLVESLKQRSHGSVFDTITKETMTGIFVIYPDNNVIIAYETLLKPVMDRILNNLEEAQTLTQLRDTLLPRLISGQLRLPEAEELVSEATS